MYESTFCQVQQALTLTRDAADGHIGLVALTHRLGQEVSGRFC